LPANLGLAVGEDIDYVEIHDKTTGENYILAKDRLSKYYKNEEDYEIVKEYKGKDLVGIEYEPLLKDILDENSDEVKIGDGAYKVVI
jgi:isoleucyl-tRNA synthetase